MTEPEHVVFDCNVYFQSLISPTGPAGALLLAVQEGRLILYASQRVFTELLDVCSRPHLVMRFHLSEERLVAFVQRMENVAQVVEDVPHVFDYGRDPDDEHYVDLAVATNATLIVSRDKDLWLPKTRPCWLARTYVDGVGP